MGSLINREFKRALNQRADEVEKSLRVYFKRSFDAPDIIIEAMCYSLFSPGKKIRPVLMREFAKLFSEDISPVIPLSDAIEMIHTYSLIHDDLPAMDDADYRRSQLSNHRAFNEAIAVLAGDGLLNLAIERALEGAFEYSTQNYLNALKTLFNASGVDGMIGGQTADIESSEGEEVDLNYIESHKTGALLKAAVLCGALPFLEKDDSRLEVLESYARAVGRAFQIVDDILDVTSTREETGKDTGLDEKNSTVTFVSLYGLERAKKEVKKLREEAHIALDKLNVKENHFLRLLTDYVCTDRRE